MSLYKMCFKRFIDLIVSILALIVFSPVFIMLLIILSISFKGSPFFIHERPGKDEKKFKLLKFKSMTDEKDDNGEYLPYNQRITKIGLFIRKASLDEIPQLINVLKGNMSLIGPRPLLIKYLALYNDFQKQRHSVKPGITGWAQVNGRNSISWEKKFELDVWYVNNISFKTDLKIILLTIKKVMLKEDINLSKTVNMTPFEGNNEI